MHTKKKNSSVSILFFLVTIALIIPSPTFAYLDPGNGSYLIQMLAASLFAGLYMGKKFWGDIKKFISNLFQKKDKNAKKST